MEPEVLIGIVGVFISGGAVGVAATLVAQLLRRTAGGGRHTTPLVEHADIPLLAEEVAGVIREQLRFDIRDELALALEERDTQLAHMGERIEFAERLLARAQSANDEVNAAPHQPHSARKA
jgi:hypothetical protein